MLRPLIAALFGYLYAPWLVTVGSCIALPTLGGVLIAIAAAAVDTPACLAASSAASPLRGSSDTVGSCIVLLALGDVLLAIGAAAVETAAAVRAVLPLRLFLRPFALVAVGSCSVLLTLRGVLIAITAAAVDTAADPRVALPL